MVSTSDVVTAEDIHVEFGEVTALDGVDLHLGQDEILGLLGDNGAGKSTLMNCLSGVIQPDSGTIKLRGNEVTFTSPRDAKQHGIETAFQDLALANNMSVAQNIFLGRERVQTVGGVVPLLAKNEMRGRTEELLERVNIDISPTERVSNLSGGERQLVAITRTLLSDPEVIILDEPTSALSVEGTDRVVELIRQLQQQGISIILISHNFEFVRRIVDRIQVLYRGQNAGELSSDASRDEIVSRMVSGMPDSESKIAN